MGTINDASKRLSLNALSMLLRHAEGEHNPSSREAITVFDHDTFFSIVQLFITQFQGAAANEIKILPTIMVFYQSRFLLNIN